MVVKSFRCPGEVSNMNDTKTDGDRNVSGDEMTRTFMIPVDDTCVFVRQKLEDALVRAEGQQADVLR